MSCSGQILEMDERDIDDWEMRVSDVVMALWKMGGIDDCLAKWKLASLRKIGEFEYVRTPLPFQALLHSSLSILAFRYLIDPLGVDVGLVNVRVIVLVYCQKTHNLMWRCEPMC